MGIDILPTAKAGGFTPRRDNGMASPESLPLCIQTVSTCKVYVGIIDKMLITLLLGGLVP